MKVAIVKYNAGNIRSVDYALKRLGVVPVITDDKESLRSADRVVFPGVGEASSTMRYLEQRRLDELIRDLRQPVLGICLGLQLMCSRSEEGDADCLGVFPVSVHRFRSEDKRSKVPHMGWNCLKNITSPLFKGIEEGAYVYFVHSYYADTCPYSVAVTPYITDFSAALHRDNFYATQFHPEKSADVGSRILENFLNLPDLRR